MRFVQAPSNQVPEFAGFPQPASRAEILKDLDESDAAVREMLPKFDDAAIAMPLLLSSATSDALEVESQESCIHLVIRHAARARLSLCGFRSLSR